MALPRPETPRTADTRRRAESAAAFECGVKYGYFTPLELVGHGGMGSLLKVQLHPEEFAVPYVTSHVLSGDLSPRLIGIHGTYQLDDPEFEEEVRRRIARVDRSSSLFQRMLHELRSREPALARADYVAALKVPSGKDVAMTSRFFREVRILHNMGDHPNIVKYISCDLVEGQLALIMEYFPADNLAEAIAAGPMPPERALRAFVSILGAIHYAHARGVIHRDIKPSNVLIRGEEIKVTDFGLAKPLTPELERTQLTLAEQVIGTPAYMAPEQVDPTLGELGEWTDVYQLGLTLFEMLTQHPLYDEREYRKKGGRDTRETDAKKLILSEVGNMGQGHPHFPRDFAPSLPDEIEKLVMTLCQKDPLERYTCELALEHAQEILNHKVFAHAEPDKPPSEDKRKERRVTLILCASEALLAKHAYEEAEAYAKASALVAEAGREADLVARADCLQRAAEVLDRLPRPKFAALYGRLEALTGELESARDDIDAFRPNRKIALEIAAGHENLVRLVEGDSFYETPTPVVRAKAEALRARAEQHLERIRRTGLPDRIVGPYIAALEEILAKLPALEAQHANRREAFLRKKREELEGLAPNNPNEAALILLTLRRALENGGEDEASRQLLAELDARYKDLPGAAAT